MPDKKDAVKTPYKMRILDRMICVFLVASSSALLCGYAYDKQWGTGILTAMIMSAITLCTGLFIYAVRAVSW
jgi:hypothetical protein